MSINVYELVTNRIIEQLENNIVPWEKPWGGTLDGAFNRVSKKPSKTYMLDIYTIPHFQLPCLKILSLTSFTPFWRLDNRYNFCTIPLIVMEWYEKHVIITLYILTI